MQRKFVPHCQAHNGIHHQADDLLDESDQFDAGSRSEAGGRERGTVPAPTRFGASGLGSGR